MHAQTHAFATLIAKQPDDYETTAQAIEDLFAGYTDERKADLYACVQEAVNRDMSFVELSDAIDGALRSNDRRFHLG